jgi:hypothetical protein
LGIVIREIDAQTANNYYYRLPLRSQISTLSPRYVLADAKRDPSLKPVFVHYEEEDKFWMLGAHLSHVPHSEYMALSSPYGYGGPLTNTADMEFTQRAWKAYCGWCRERLVLCEVMKLHPLAYHPYLGERKFNRFVYNCGFKPTPSCRNKINKGRHHKLTVTQVHNSVIAKNFPIDYGDAMAEVKADPFYFFNDEYFKAMSELDDSCLVICEEEEQWRAACLLLAGGLCMESHLTITNARGRNIGATNFLFHVARETLDDSMPLFLGGGKTTSESDALAKFKESFGGERLAFNIGWKIHRPDVYSEMKADNKSDRVLFWQ